jgi:PIN domain nuclease of toxin-antitoxin system
LKFLIDTNIFLFAIEDSKRLSKKAILLLEDESNELLLSQASLWEITIKHSIGKLQFEDGLKKTMEQGIEKLDLQMMPIRSNHIYRVSELPFHHNDPFDRLLAAQCLEEKISIITTDPIFKKYKVSGQIG